MRKLTFGVLGLAALGFGALSAQPAAAHSPYPGYGYRSGPVVEYRYGPRYWDDEYEYRYPRRAHRPYRDYRPYREYRAYREHRPYGYYRRPYAEKQRCETRIRQTRHGNRIVQEPYRVCR